MFKKCKVVMLPTDKAEVGTLLKAKEFNLIVLNKHYLTQEYIREKTDYSSANHLYILSDDEIKEGDWYYSKKNNIIYHTDKDAIKNKLKVIASTDPSLTKEYFTGVIDESNGVKEMQKEFLPSPSQSFIEKYVSEYNKGNIITEVIVKYDEEAAYCRPDPLSGDNAGEPERIIYIPKINAKDNTITIKKIKDSWTRTEVIGMLNQVNCLSVELEDFDINEWIETNL